MKKRNKILAALLAGTLGISSLLTFAGCDNDHLLSAYTGGDKDASGNPIYNTSLLCIFLEQVRK